MSQHAEIEAFVKKLLGEKIEKSGKTIAITDDLNFIQSGLMDSVGFLDLLGAVEDEFDIEVDFDDKDPEEFLNLKGFLKSIYQATEQ